MSGVAVGSIVIIGASAYGGALTGCLAVVRSRFSGSWECVIPTPATLDGHGAAGCIVHLLDGDVRVVGRMPNEGAAS